MRKNRLRTLALASVLATGIAGASTMTATADTPPEEDGYDTADVPPTTEAMDTMHGTQANIVEGTTPPPAMAFALFDQAWCVGDGMSPLRGTFATCRRLAYDAVDRDEPVCGGVGSGRRARRGAMRHVVVLIGVLGICGCGGGGSVADAGEDRGDVANDAAKHSSSDE